MRDIFGSQTLDVQAVTDQTVGESHGSGNQYQATVEDQDTDVVSNQFALGNVTADTRLNVVSNSGAVTSLNTTAVGNAGEVGVTGAVITSVLLQETGPAAIRANSQITAPAGQAGDVDAYIQSQGNGQVITADHSTAGVRVIQTNGAAVTSDGGGVYAYIKGEAQFQAVASANDLTYSGSNGSGARLVTDQTNNAMQTLAAQFTAYGQVQDGKTITNAVGNSVDAINQGFLMDATATQTNRSNVRSQASSSAATFGAISTDAHSTGNNIVVGDLGGEVRLDSTQINDGGVDAIAVTSAGEGYDAYASASAAGNAVVGYACAECTGRMTITNNQTNSNDIGASTTTTSTGSARSVTGVANAVGNSAVYYVRKPGSN
ncbi:MAG: holdfast anchor protein HfaD [Alphaproteobacteria bacterium]